MVVLINKIQDEVVHSICADHGNRPDELLEILHAIQAEKGFLSDSNLRDVAEALNISQAEIHGVVSFYHDFKRTAQAGLSVKICRAEACQAMGCEALAASAEKIYEKNQEVHIETVYCLGNCALSPAIMIDEKLYGRITPERLALLVEQHVSNKGKTQ